MGAPGMINTTVEINQIRISKAKPGTRMTDTKATGLILEISPARKATWYLRLSIRLKQTKYKIGTFPGLSIGDARKIALEHRAAAMDGHDPRLTLDTKTKKKAGGVESWTLEELTDAYIGWAQQGWKPRSGRGAEIRARMAHHVYPEIPAQTLALNVKLDQVLAVLEPLAKDRPAQFDKVQKLLAAIINHQTIADPKLKGVALHLDRGELKKYFRRYTAKHSSTSYAHVPVDEIPAFCSHFQKVATQNPVKKAVAPEALLFTLLTSARTAEVIGHKPKKGNPERHTPPMKWREVDLEAGLWTIPGDRTKNGFEHIIPLSKFAVALLRKVRAKTERFAPDDIVFPSHLGKSGLMSNNALLSQIKKGPRYKIMTRKKHAAGKVEERAPTVHGLRTSFNTFALKAGYPPILASLAIAHKPDHYQQDSSFENYMSSQMVEERRALMDDWANFCANGIKPKGWCSEVDHAKLLQFKSAGLEVLA